MVCINRMQAQNPCNDSTFSFLTLCMNTKTLWRH